MEITSPRFLEDLRRTEIVNRLRADSRLRDIDAPGAMDVIGWGQAEFDQPLGEFSPQDRVLLYAYWNQPGHLAELSEAFRQLFAETTPTNPIVVDLGCGPFTGGLALAGQIDPNERIDYVGVDRSRAMREFGEQLASALESIRGTPRIRRHWADDVDGVRWQARLGWRPVIVIVSFLLASPTLQVNTLLAGLDRLLSRMSRGPTTVLYTNSPRARANRSYTFFRDALTKAGFRLMADDTGTVQTERATRKLRYALFHRRKQGTLTLGDN